MNDVIVIQLQGGLGNQMFQYALGRSMQLQHQRNIVYDQSWFATQEKRKYELDVFNTQVEFASVADIKELQRYQQKPGLPGLLSKWFNPHPQRYVKERKFSFIPEVLTIAAPVYLEGFWQTEKYFTGVTKQLKQEFTVKEPPDSKNATLLNDIHASAAIALHVRRGDYVSEKKTNAFHGTPTIAYYQKAIEKMQILEPQGKIFVFSDDPQWSKEHLHFPLPTKYVDCNPPDKGHHDLRLMAACRHHIIANSSFSWWGAWLGSHPEQQVIAPKQWFADTTIDTKDLIPDRWLRI